MAHRPQPLLDAGHGGGACNGPSACEHSYNICPCWSFHIFLVGYLRIALWHTCPKGMRHPQRLPGVGDVAGAFATTMASVM